MFGFTYVYLDHQLLFALRASVKRSGTNGLWIFTTDEHLEAQAAIVAFGKNCWIVLASRLEDFEEYALKACELVLNGDQRVGRVTRGGTLQSLR